MSAGKGSRHVGWPYWLLAGTLALGVPLPWRWAAVGVTVCVWVAYRRRRRNCPAGVVAARAPVERPFDELDEDDVWFESHRNARRENLAGWKRGALDDLRGRTA